MTYEEALQICRKNLKGSHDKDLLATAHALKFLTTPPEGKTQAEIGKQFGVKGSIVGQFLGLLRLSEAIQQLVEGKQLGLDKAHQLGRLRTRPEGYRLEVAKAMIGITAKRARLLVGELAKHPQLTLDEAMKRAEEKDAALDRPVRLVVMLQRERHRELKRLAERNNQPAEQMAADLLGRFLDEADREVPL